ncbi:beta-galactosidase [Serinibacter arcticus]|uniref:beta-galactosidase n=1 Tax=Serinibacter arcticus TaxID=1655435 RepID=UPI0011B1EE5F|nr:beta-galactosidase [Serinibacter arcticus]
MTDVRLARRQLLVDGVPTLVVAGEIHYFRLRREHWRGRLELLRTAGADTVATYVPWVVHERADGTLDLTGRTDPTLDLGAFLDLAAELGLQALVRPGPFVMAEMAGEGVPDRVRREHPEVVPVGWGGATAPTGDLDYLAPAFLAETRRWYAAVGEVVGPRTAPNGGPVIAVQLDNEIGMLAWVSGSPQLTADACVGLRDWLAERYGDGLVARYPGLPDACDPAALADAVRRPREGWATALRLDLGRFSRERFATYVDALEEAAESAGMGGVPFLINVHGTTGGSGASFPIGLSQLALTFPGHAQRAAGSDHYLGDLTLATAGDLHLMNAHLAALSDDEQPATSLEHEAGHADYGDDLAARTDPSAVVLKTRLSLAQGHRLLNFYLFAGGTNFVADPPRSDGTTRFGITGERHGFAAPVGPEGQRGPSFDSTAEAMRVAARLAPWLADADEEHDDLALALVLDDYLTEYPVPGSDDDAHAVAELAHARGGGPRGLLPRVLLTLGYRYGAVDLARDGDLPRTVVLGSPVAADAAVQARLATHVRGGGSLLLLGSLPTTELDGTPCTILSDALGVRVVGEVRDRPGWFTSVTSTWGHGTERRVGRAQLYEAEGAQVVLAEAMSGTPCGLALEAGAGRAVVLGCDWGADLGLFTTALTWLGAAPGLVREAIPGLITLTTRAADGSRLLHALNVGGSPVSTSITLDGVALWEGAPLTLQARTGVALPIGVRVSGHSLTATAEIESVDGWLDGREDGWVDRGVAILAGPGRAWLDGTEVEVVRDEDAGSGAPSFRVPLGPAR